MYTLNNYASIPSIMLQKVNQTSASIIHEISLFLFLFLSPFWLGGIIMRNQFHTVFKRNTESNEYFTFFLFSNVWLNHFTFHNIENHSNTFIIQLIQEMTQCPTFRIHLQSISHSMSLVVPICIYHIRWYPVRITKFFNKYPHTPWTWVQVSNGSGRAMPAWPNYFRA